MGFFQLLKAKQPDRDGACSVDDQDRDQAPPDPPSSSSAETKKSAADHDFQPPPGPPSYPIPPENPPPYPDWTSIPDASLLPPPPSFGHKSSRNNAAWDDAARAHAFCDQFPPYVLARTSAAVQEAVRKGHIVLQQPKEFAGELEPVRTDVPGLWSARSSKRCGDCVLLSKFPLYLTATDSPLHTKQRKTIYFEVRLVGVGGGENGIAIGYCAKPYPTWRLPGWERASLGVHGDDGRRFVNDTWGGKDFTTKFVAGETVGIGMEFGVPVEGTSAGRAEVAHAEAFFTRNGKRAGGWRVEEELDRDDQSEGARGLNGELDLYAAIGVFGEVKFEVVFAPQRWMFQPGG